MQSFKSNSEPHTITSHSSITTHERIHGDTENIPLLTIFLLLCEKPNYIKANQSFKPSSMFVDMAQVCSNVHAGESPSEMKSDIKQVHLGAHSHSVCDTSGLCSSLSCAKVVLFINFSNTAVRESTMPSSYCFSTIKKVHILLKFLLKIILKQENINIDVATIFSAKA